MTIEDKTFAQRFATWMRLQDISFKEISDVLGSTQQAIRGYARGDSFIDFKKLSRLAEHYPDLNMNWLITGNGEMLNKTEVKIHETSPHVAFIDVHEIKKEITDSVTQNISKKITEMLAGKYSQVPSTGQFAMSM